MSTMLKHLIGLNARVLEDAGPLAAMLAEDLARRFGVANRRQTAAWEQVDSLERWQQFRDERLAALRRSLGRWPDAAPKVEPRVTGRLSGDGFAIENLVFASRPHLVVTANLYVPDPPGEAMPAILIAHSHHNPKTQGELQDMGVNWARTGCLVLVIDLLGHGERRQQPFGKREDYHSRYVLGMQLDLVGESLIGWIVWDLLRGVDLLLARPGVDPKRVILLGAVAGGGDPAAVAAALDDRITCSIPFNFGAAGGPDAAEPNFACTGSWESTRALRDSAHDGFVPWVIVAAAAPRHLVSAHEFEWSAETDPAYQRIRRVYEMHDAADRLASVAGWGAVAKRPPAASHCNNIGVPHREQLYPILGRWFDMPAPAPEVQQRREPAELACLTDEARRALQPKMLHELAAELADERLAEARANRANLRDALASRLGDIVPTQDPVEKQRTTELIDGATLERIVLEVEPGVRVPMLLLIPAGDTPAPVVLGVAYEGKERFLRENAESIAALLTRGTAVCLPDVRGTGETAPEFEHRWRVEWNWPGTAISSSELMLGETLLGSRLRDVRSVLRYLANRPEVDVTRVATWGDSFAPVNPPEFDIPPLKTDNPPHLAEPMGPLLALLTALYEQGVQAVFARRGIESFSSLLAAPTCYVPHDVIVPGILEVADIPDIIEALAPRSVRWTAPVDGLNRATSPEAEGDVADWLAAALGR